VRFRPAALADAEAVTVLVNGRELLDRGVTEATVAEIRAQWTTAEIEITADGLIRMRLALDGAPAATQLQPSADIRIRTIDVERDAHELHGLDATAFATNADYQPETFEQFRDEHLRSLDVDARAMLVAVDESRIVGFLLGARRRGREVGHVSVLGVDPQARRRGIARLLLGSAFEVWRTDGISRAELTVASDNPGARRRYDRLGMEIAYTLDCYERPLRPARGRRLTPAR
jgi:ribosomal-protein-alanine N-acetyltransferase